MKIKYRITKNQFLIGFIAVTLLLALVRLIFPSVAGKGYAVQKSVHDTIQEDSVNIPSEPADTIRTEPQPALALPQLSHFFNTDGTLSKHRITGVRDYDESFPDSQSLQLAAALKYGVRPVIDRADAEKRKGELVYVGSNPFFDMKRLNNSVPYLVPRAAILLQDIARNFMDSLQMKGVPLNKLLVSSILRTKEDVQRLRQHNHNATENSCHLYGTTFDIAYNKYGSITRPVRDDTLKWILSEVLNDIRRQGRCYIKHEKRQGCFHITVR
ncbi:DUF5715 family protein [Prevotella dentasini]|uniref:DUF5715 family protein n=1 Tax=Prevotella dentasini TaxID=589537 RepID=UPI000469ABE0|nr:DUF5715 family protein [Prevotella dentasini]